MKILILSLLRIGDVAIAAPVLRDLRARHPHAQIDLLVNSQAAAIAPLLPSVDRVIRFERDQLQRGLGQAEIPFFASYEKLNALMDELNSEHYDQVVNLTHSRLSGWIMSLVEAKQKIGLCFDGQGKASFGSNWFRYLNSQTDADGREVFHFADVFRFGLGLEGSASRGESLRETEKGAAEADQVLDANGVTAGAPFISVQALTSDVKKDWGLKRFERALSTFASRHPGVAIAILCAPFESERLAPLAAALQAAGHNAFLAVTGFEAAYSVVKRAKLLLTLDTSIKHLAACAGIPIVEISLGSSDPYRTGAYRHGAVIVQSKEACAPCTHSKACHRESQFCATRIPSDAVALIASEVFSGRTFQLAAVVEEYRAEIDVLQVDLRSNGFWAAASLDESFTEESVARWIDLACRKIWLRGTVNGVDTVGSEMLQLSNYLRKLHPTVSEVEWRHLLEGFEKQAELVEGRLNGLKAGVRHLHGSFENPNSMKDFVRGLISFRERLRHSTLLSSFRQCLDQVIEDDISPSFTRFRHIIDALNEIEKRTAIHMRIVRTMTSQIDQRSELESP